jgi:molecular chaperone GrpE
VEENKNEEIKEEKKAEEPKEHKKEHNKDKKLEELQNEVNTLKDKNMRIAAEMVNTLRRKDEETNRLLKYSNESLITELLPVIDNFERALNVDATSNDIESYQKGMTMIYNSLKNILEKFEVKEIEAIDKEFDPSYHQAVMQEEKEGTKENIVIEVLQKGYTYKDKVIRPAMVKVSK